MYVAFYHNEAFAKSRSIRGLVILALASDMGRKAFGAYSAHQATGTVKVEHGYDYRELTSQEKENLDNELVYGILGFQLAENYFQNVKGGNK